MLSEILKIILWCSHYDLIALALQAFLEQVREKAQGDVGSALIGQFGVGFYSTFMVGDKVDVYTKSYKPGSEALKWSSDGYVCTTACLLELYAVYSVDNTKRMAPRNPPFEVCQR